MSPELVERIKRLLVLIPYVVKHPRGVPVSKVIEFAGYGTEGELYADLDMLRLIGIPPCAPDDLIEIDVLDGRVVVALPQGFTRPPRLSAVEAAALLAAADPLRDASGSVLESAVTKLRSALPPGSEDALDELVRAAAIEAAPRSPWHDAIAGAIEKRLEIVVDYYAASQGKAASRTLEPRVLFMHRSRWYLAAWDPGKSAEHLYRLDRMKQVTVGARCFGEHKGTEDGRYQRDVLFLGAERHPEVEVVFDEALARLAVEQWGPLAKKNEDGTVTVVTRMAGEAYAISWAMGYAGRVRFVRPLEYQKALEARSKELMALYA